MRINKTYYDVDWKEYRKKHPDVTGKGALKKLFRKEIGIEKKARKEK